MDYTVVWHEALSRFWFALIALAWIFCMIFVSYKMKGIRVMLFIRVVIYLGITAAYLGIVISLSAVGIFE